jgi:hypothetical protein
MVNGIVGDNSDTMREEAALMLKVLRVMGNGKANRAI